MSFSRTYWRCAPIRLNTLQRAFLKHHESECQECWRQRCRNHRNRKTVFSNHHINISLFMFSWRLTKVALRFQEKTGRFYMCALGARNLGYRSVFHHFAFPSQFFHSPLSCVHSPFRPPVRSPCSSMYPPSCCALRGCVWRARLSCPRGEPISFSHLCFFWAFPVLQL